MVKSILFTIKVVSPKCVQVYVSPFTSFRNELHYGVYDDVVDEVIEAVEKIIGSQSKYFNFAADAE